jgi:hypothetical protein
VRPSKKGKRGLQNSCSHCPGTNEKEDGEKRDREEEGKEERGRERERERERKEEGR